jgi:prophage tail gpP-like protein
MNIGLLEQFDKFLIEDGYTVTDNLTDLANTSIIIHYKKLLGLACKNQKQNMNSAELTNCLVRFLIGISAYSINLNIVLDGIKPYVMSEN